VISVFSAAGPGVDGVAVWHAGRMQIVNKTAKKDLVFMASCGGL
jgi:hypothetical protein